MKPTELLKEIRKGDKPTAPGGALPRSATAAGVSNTSTAASTAAQGAGLYTDLGSHYWLTHKVSGKVDPRSLTQFGRAMKQLGIEMIPAYSPKARGRCEQMFSIHQNRLPRDLAAQDFTPLKAANRYLNERYLPTFNREFSVSAAVKAAPSRHSSTPV